MRKTWIVLTGGLIALIAIFGYAATNGDGESVRPLGHVVHYDLECTVNGGPQTGRACEVGNASNMIYHIRLQLSTGGVMHFDGMPAYFPLRNGDCWPSTKLNERTICNEWAAENLNP